MMSDCDKCWETPCSCGWGYRNDTKSRRIKLAAAVLGIKSTLVLEKLNQEIPTFHPMKEKEKE